MTRFARTAGLFAGLLVLTPTATAADWPQWMGPNRDDVWPETGIVQKFPQDGPKVLWREPIGGGYSGPAVVDGKVYVTDKLLKPGATEPKDPFDIKNPVPSVERVLCLDAKTGNKLWKHEYDCPYQVSYQCGPRCTPTVNGGKVYTLGTMGDLYCLDSGTGKEVWSKNFPKDYAAKVPLWGFSGHPLVYQNLLICLVGGEKALIVAFEKDTGKEVWKVMNTPDSNGPGYGPPTLLEIGGVTQVVVYHSRGITALNPLTGEKFWDVAMESFRGMAIMAPRKDGDLLFAGGYVDKCVVIKLGPGKSDAKELWRGDKKAVTGLYPVNMTPFVEGGVIYGVDKEGALRAIDLKTGKRLWSTFKPVFGEDKDDGFSGGGSGTAFLTKNGDRFFIFAETGDLVIAKLSPSGYEELSRAHLLEQTGAAFGRKVVWSHPAYAGKCVFARNDKEIICVSLAAK